MKVQEIINQNFYFFFLALNINKQFFYVFFFNLVYSNLVLVNFQALFINNVIYQC